jgi:uncharacterized membrane protein
MNGNAVAGLSLFIVGEILLIALLFHFLPQITRTDLFFAVTVQPAFRSSPDAGRALRQFRVAVWVHSLIALGMVLVSVLFDFLLLVIVAVVWQIAGACVAFVRARKRVLPHAVTPISNREAALLPRSAGAAFWLLQLGPFAILAARAAYLRANWQHIPERFPVHWGLDGRPNGWSARSFAGVYGPLLIAAGICLLLVLSSYAIVHWTRHVRSSGDAAVREGRFRRAQLGIITAIAYLMALTFSELASPLRSNAQQEPHLTLLLGGTFLLVLALFIVMFSIGQGGANLARGHADAAPGGVELVIGDRTPERYWKAGMFYFNPDDPALLVEKRFGMGYTINFGHRGAWLIVAAFLAVIILPLLIAFGVYPR